MPVVPVEAPVAIPQPEPPVMPAEAPGMEYHEPERGVLRLLARDPHWLFATWEFSDASLEHCRLHSSDGRLHLKVHALDHGRGKEQEIVLTAEACEWFIPVQEAGTTCQVEMGYRNWADAWVTMANPATASTPAEAPAAPAAAQMRTVVFPPEKAAPRPVLNAGAEIKSVPSAENRPAPRITIAPEVPWIPEVQAALGNLSALVLKAQIPVAAQSLHLAAPERAFQGPEAAPSPAGLPSSIPGALSLPTSPQPGPLAPLNLPGAAPARKFWLTVNAELIVYGATEPDARVEIGGHPVRLRPDGGFSFRFALPDGRYELPVAALSADGAEFRGAVLQFERNTQIAGTVGVHPQDPKLKEPAPESCV
jgi:hypothetical protein